MSEKTDDLSSEELLERGRFSIEYLSPCGIYCGLCYQITRDKKKCHGCYSGKGFAKFETKFCGIIRCCEKQNISRCNECEIFPNCETLKNFITWDSFVTHGASIDNLKRLSELGEEKFILDLKDRVKKGEFPPKIRPGGMRPKNMLKMMRNPYKQIQKK